MAINENDDLTPDQLDVLDVLYNIADPELGVNVVDLGLVRAIDVTNNEALITMTLTSPACPLTEELETEVHDQLVVGGIMNDVRLEWTFLPPWDVSHVTSEGRDQLRALGMSI